MWYLMFCCMCFIFYSIVKLRIYSTRHGMARTLVRKPLTVKCVGSGHTWPWNRTCLLRNVWLRDGVFVGDRVSPEVYLMNRNGQNSRWALRAAPRDAPTPLLPFRGCVLLVEGFHSNPGHNMWDFMYPSWFGLRYFHPAAGAAEDFQWVTTRSSDGAGWPLSLLERFAGRRVLSLSEFARRYGDRHFPCLIVGSGGRGIGVRNSDGEVEIGALLGRANPVRDFRDRLYARFGVVPSTSRDTILVVHSKRPLYNVTLIAKRVAARHDLAVREVRWQFMTFREQLQALGRAAILVVGVGTVRANAPLLRDGAVVVQTCTPVLWNPPSYIHCFDDQMSSTGRGYVRVEHVLSYSRQEAHNAMVVPGGEFERALERASVPSPPEANYPGATLHPIVRQVFRRLCEAVPAVCVSFLGIHRFDAEGYNSTACGSSNDIDDAIYWDRHGPLRKCLSPAVLAALENFKISSNLTAWDEFDELAVDTV